MKITKILTGTAVSVAMAIGMASTAQAAWVATIDGNDCAGVFGIPAEDCKIPAKYDPKESPVIAKIDFIDKGDKAGTWAIWVNSSLWSTLDGSEFSVDVVWDPIEKEWASTGSWSYNPGVGDPIINWFVAKGGSEGFNLYSSPNALTGTFNNNDGTLGSGPGGAPGISHLTLYDTGNDENVVPLPAAAWLLLSGLLGLGALGRKKVSA